MKVAPTPAYSPDIDADHPSGPSSQDAWPTRDYYHFDNHDEHDMMREALTRIPEVKLVRLRTLTDMELVLRADAELSHHPYIGLGGSISHRVQVDLWRLVRHRLADYYPFFIRCGKLDTEISRKACEIYRWRTTERIAALYPDLTSACTTYLEDPRREAVKELVAASPARARVRDHSVEREARMAQLGSRTPDAAVLLELSTGPALAHRIAEECSWSPEVLNGLARRGASNAALEKARGILQERFFAGLASRSA